MSSQSNPLNQPGRAARAIEPCTCRGSRRSLACASALLCAATIGSPALAGAVCEGDLNGDGVVDGADLAVMFANFGQSGGSADVNGDGKVDGQDLGKILSNWGACAPSCSNYQSLNFVGKIVGGAGQPIPFTVLNGTVNVLPTGEPQGTMSVISFDGSNTVVTLALTSATVLVDTSIVSFPATGPGDLASVDGVPTSIFAMLDEFMADLLSGLPPAMWSVASRAILPFAALVETDPFCCDLNISLVDGTPAATAFWGKIGTVGLSASVCGDAIDGCKDLGGACQGDSTTEVGKFDMPCETVVPLCVDDEFAGPTATFKAISGLWLGQ